MLYRWQYSKSRDKEGEEMGSLANELMEALELKTSFVIPIAGGIGTGIHGHNMGNHGNRHIALHHICKEPESRSRRTAGVCGSTGWIYLWIHR